MTERLECGDCKELVRRLAGRSVHAVVSDPPYEINFMAKGWDRSQIAHDVALWRDVLAALKPGGHVAAFGATRTQHRLACAIEDAGFEIRDALAWLYGQGFPKSLNLSKEADRVGKTRGKQVGTLAQPAGNVAGSGVSLYVDGFGAETVPLYEPGAALAEELQGLGTALKPSYEPVVLGRAPLDGTVIANMVKHGCGGLNVDECRIGDEGGTASGRVAGPSVTAFRNGLNGGGKKPINVGRWPANVICDEYAAATIDAQSGRTVSRSSPLDEQGRRPGGFGDIGAAKGAPCRNGPAYNDEGGASRFFYCAKASTAEREAGLGDLPALSAGELTGGRAEGSAGLQSPRAGAGRTSKSGRRNVHATVKPITLMRWLVRLLTRPGDTVLDPFMGSGTTGIACVLEGRNFIGFELDPVHFEIAQRRIAAARAGFFAADESGKTVVREPVTASRQASLFDL